MCSSHFRYSFHYIYTTLIYFKMFKVHVQKANRSSNYFNPFHNKFFKLLNRFPHVSLEMAAVNNILCVKLASCYYCLGYF